MNAWEVLGLEPTQDIRAIKRAYSVKLKSTRPDDDAQAYQELREAYDWAQQHAKFYAAYSIDDSAPEQVLDSVAEPAAALMPEPTFEPSIEPIVEPATPDATPDATPAAAAEPLPPPIATGPTVDGLLQECKRIFAQQGTDALLSAWPAQHALLDELPIGEHHHASRAFAQFVLEEPELPVEVLIALTRYFQWGRDFRADQSLGPQLAQALYLRLSTFDVFAAFHPENYTQYAWALSLAKLYDAKRRLWARLLAAVIDCPTRLKIWQAPPSLLHALGCTRASAQATQNYVATGGTIQALVFGLLLVMSLIFLDDPQYDKKSFIGAVFTVFALVFLFRADSKSVRDAFSLLPLRHGKRLDWVPLVPLSVAALLFIDQHFAWLGGYFNHPDLILWMSACYIGLWLATPTHEHVWSELLLPTFILLLSGINEYASTIHAPLLTSLAFAWAMGAHVVLRRYPEQVEVVIANVLKLGLLRIYPLAVLAFKLIAVVWVVVALALLPVLLFRMAARYCVPYAVAAICAGILLNNIRSTDGQTQGLLLWVLGVVFCIQILQTMSQRLADAVLKKLQA